MLPHATPIASQAPGNLLRQAAHRIAQPRRQRFVAWITMGTVESQEAQPGAPGAPAQDAVAADGEPPLEPEATIPPWHCDDPAISALMKTQMLAFTALPAQERRVILGGDSPPGFRMSITATTGMAMAALAEDPNLQKARDNLVRYGGTDHAFWRSYFSLGKCLAGIWVWLGAVAWHSGHGCCGMCGMFMVPDRVMVPASCSAEAAC